MQMKVTHAVSLAALLACTLMAPLSAQERGSRRTRAAVAPKPASDRGAPPSAGLNRSELDGQGADDIRTLEAAMKCLTMNGYAEEARELGRILREMRAKKPARRSGAFDVKRSVGVERRTTLGADEPPTARVRALRGIGYVGTEARSTATDLTYIEGRVPVLKLARDAYSLRGVSLDPEARRSAKAWMTWMYTVGKNRVTDTQTELPPVSGPLSMDLLIERIADAGDVYERVGDLESARRCRDLAVYYERRGEGKAVDNSATRPPAPAGVDVEPSEPVADDPRAPSIQSLELRIRSIEAQLQALREALVLPRRAAR
ncbi:MAG: hypothetical protein ACI80K_002418 [Paracoccaceae bacterium]|jgi:hypothetical protein